LKFFKYLKHCREAQHMTQETLVAALYAFEEQTFESLDTVTLSRWERGSTQPNALKQLGIVKYFQTLNNEALPCWNGYTRKEVEDLICMAGIRNVLAKNKKLILNFPSDHMEIGDLRVYPVLKSERAQVALELNMDLHQATNYLDTQLSSEQFKSWAKHPSALFLVSEYKNAFAGLFFSLRLKQSVFEKLMHFEMKKSELSEKDFAEEGEEGSDFLLSFYALNQKIAMMLFVRHYAYLIAYQKDIVEIGVITALDEVKKTVHNMNLSFYDKKVLQKGVSLEAYRQDLAKVLATEYVMKMLFSE